jgi:hypothetical protein
MVICNAGSFSLHLAGLCPESGLDEPGMGLQIAPIFGASLLLHQQDILFKRKPLAHESFDRHLLETTSRQPDVKALLRHIDQTDHLLTYQCVPEIGRIVMNLDTPVCPDSPSKGLLAYVV